MNTNFAVGISSVKVRIVNYAEALRSSMAPTSVRHLEEKYSTIAEFAMKAISFVKSDEGNGKNFEEMILIVSDLIEKDLSAELSHLYHYKPSIIPFEYIEYSKESREYNMILEYNIVTDVRNINVAFPYITEESGTPIAMSEYLELCGVESPDMIPNYIRDMFLNEITLSNGSIYVVSKVLQDSYGNTNILVRFKSDDEMDTKERIRTPSKAKAATQTKSRKKKTPTSTQSKTKSESKEK